MILKYEEYTKGSFLLRWDTSIKSLIIEGCDKCKECCGKKSGEQLLYLTKEQLDRGATKYYYLDKFKRPLIHGTKGCKALTPKGCPLKYQDKAIQCRIYPYRLSDKTLVVDTRCRAVQNQTLIHLQKLGLEVMTFLYENLDKEFLFDLMDTGALDENHLNLKIFFD